MIKSSFDKNQPFIPHSPSPYRRRVHKDHIHTRNIKRHSWSKHDTSLSLYSKRNCERRKILRYYSFMKSYHMIFFINNILPAKNCLRWEVPWKMHHWPSLILLKQSISWRGSDPSKNDQYDRIKCTVARQNFQID